jgi:hypothetical protein
LEEFTRRRSVAGIGHQVLGAMFVGFSNELRPSYTVASQPKPIRHDGVREITRSPCNRRVHSIPPSVSEPAWPAYTVPFGPSHVSHWSFALSLLQLLDSPESRQNVNGDGFISLCLGYSTDDLFTSEFLQIIGGAPSAILGFTLPAQRSHLMGQLGGGEASDRRGERQDCFGTQRMRGLLKSKPPTLVLPTWEGAGSCSRVPSAMKH